MNMGMLGFVPLETIVKLLVHAKMCESVKHILSPPKRCRNMAKSAYISTPEEMWPRFKFRLHLLSTHGLVQRRELCSNSPGSRTATVSVELQRHPRHRRERDGPDRIENNTAPVVATGVC